VTFTDAELVDQALAGLVLLEVTARAGVERASAAVLERRAAQDEHTRPRREADDVGGRAGAVHPGQAEIHHHDVRVERRGERDRLLPARGLAHDQDVVSLLEEGVQAETEERVVLGDEDADRGRAGHHGDIAAGTRGGGTATSCGPSVRAGRR